MFIENITYITQDWFTGGTHYYKYLGNGNFEITMEEIDGTHTKIDHLDIQRDEAGNEFILLHTYKGEKHYLYAMNDQHIIYSKNKHS